MSLVCGKVLARGTPGDNTSSYPRVGGGEARSRGREACSYVEPFKHAHIKSFLPLGQPRKAALVRGDVERQRHWPAPPLRIRRDYKSEIGPSRTTPRYRERGKGYVNTVHTHLRGGRGCVVAHVVQPRVPRGGDGTAVVVMDVGVFHPSVLAYHASRTRQTTHVQSTHKQKLRGAPVKR